MNENDQTSVPPSVIASVEPTPPLQPPKPKKTLSWWLRTLFVCNPFYLVSAALLLYGCYRVSIDTPLFDAESARLAFNFTSVQFYEILVVITAIFLARRGIWYDSTLLVGLENLLVFVPFILISQAALIESNLAMEMCLVGAAVAVVRFGGLKRHFTQLNLPASLLAIGSLLLLLNVALPLIYRHFGETKIGVYIDSGPAYEMNECTWLLILPAVLALVNLLPRARVAGSLLPQHRWLPLGLFSLWIAVTCAHLYGLDFIYQFNLRGELLAPAAAVLAWTIFLRVPTKSRWQTYALTFLPLGVPLLSTSPGGRRTFLILAAVNIAAYGAVCLLDRKNRVARHLTVIAGLLFVAGMPASWLPSINPEIGHADWIAGGFIVYMLCWITFSNHPGKSVLGSFIFGAAILAVFRHHAAALQWAMQGGFIFLLLHSLCWNDQDHLGANLLRMSAAVAWIVQSFVWMHSEYARFWMSFVPGAVVLAVCFACQLYQFEWKKSVIPAAAFFVLLSGPGTAAIHGLSSTPVGLLAVTGSFLLFGFGTAAALTRHHWHHANHDLETKIAHPLEVKP
ncbi:MAG TPA: hypothetical protein VG347_04140 [Verrucomicrobiae bacterium]|nr:hypothetical protein [Verrucomicrobiae bacterium]